MASRGDEGGLPLIPLMYPDEFMHAAEVQLAEDSGFAEMLECCRDERKRIR